MKKTILPIIIFLTISHKALTQQYSFQELTPLKKIELGTHGFGLSYEMVKNQRITLDLAVGLGGGHRIDWRSFQYSWLLFNPSAYIKVQGKFYYNRTKRIQKKRVIKHNSGPYIGGLLTYTTANIINSDYLSSNYRVRPAGQVSLHWGYQRILSERIVSNIHLGLAITEDFESGYSMPSPSLNIRFSYLLGKIEY